MMLHNLIFFPSINHMRSRKILVCKMHTKPIHKVTINFFFFLYIIIYKQQQQQQQLPHTQLAY